MSPYSVNWLLCKRGWNGDEKIFFSGGVGNEKKARVRVGIGVIYVPLQHYNARLSPALLSYRYHVNETVDQTHLSKFHFDVASSQPDHQKCSIPLTHQRATVRGSHSTQHILCMPTPSKWVALNEVGVRPSVRLSARLSHTFSSKDGTCYNYILTIKH